MKHLLFVLFALLIALSTGEVAIDIATRVGWESARWGLSGVMAALTFAAALIFIYRN